MMCDTTPAGTVHSTQTQPSPAIGCRPRTHCNQTRNRSGLEAERLLADAAPERLRLVSLCLRRSTSPFILSSASLLLLFVLLSLLLSAPLPPLLLPLLLLRLLPCQVMLALCVSSPLLLLLSPSQVMRALCVLPLLLMLVLLPC